MDEGYFELEGYGVKLKRLTHDKIEMVRQWRNDPKISQYMFYREYITPEMQEKWFANLDKKCNYYFIIEYDGKDVGLINIKDIDWEKRCGEPGQFMYYDEYLDSDVSLRASLCMGDWIWSELGLEYELIEVVRTNKRALDFNRLFGYKEMKPLDGDSYDKIRMILCKKDALQPNKLLDRLRKIFNKTK